MSSSLQPLYDRDFNLWCQDTINKIASHDYSRIDWDNLQDELAGLAGRDRRELRSRLTTLYEHLLKRCYVGQSDNYSGWEITIRRTQLAIKNILIDSPSLRNYFTTVQTDCYADAYELVQREYKKWELPKFNPFSLDIEQLLSAKIIPDYDEL